VFRRDYAELKRWPVIPFDGHYDAAGQRLLATGVLEHLATEWPEPRCPAVRTRGSRLHHGPGCGGCRAAPRGGRGHRDRHAPARGVPAGRFRRGIRARLRHHQGDLRPADVRDHGPPRVPGDRTFGSAVVIEGDVGPDDHVYLRITIHGANGRSVDAIYDLVREGSQWRINGV